MKIKKTQGYINSIPQADKYNNISRLMGIVLIKKHSSWDWDSSVICYMMHKHEGKCSIPWNIHWKKWVLQLIPVITVLGDQRQRVPWACEQASLADLASSKFSERSWLKKKKKPKHKHRMTEIHTHCQPVPCTHTHMTMCLCIYAYVFMPVCTCTCKQ